MAERQQPILLAIETSGDACGVAVSGTQIQYAAQFDGRYLHDRFLAEIAYRALRDIGIAPEQVDAVAVSAGPGSFTGLRIGAAFAKGFCLTSPPVLIAVPTAEAIAFAAQELTRWFPETPIVVLLPSHRNKVYAQEFRFAPAPSIGSLELLDSAEAQQRYDTPDFIVVGPGAPLCPAAKTVSLFNRLDVRFIAHRALAYWEEQRFTDPATFVPLYGQDFVPGQSQKSR